MCEFPSLCASPKCSRIPPSLPQPQQPKWQERRRLGQKNTKKHNPPEAKGSRWSQGKTTPSFIVSAARPRSLSFPGMFSTPQMCRPMQSLSIKSKEGCGPTEPCLSRYVIMFHREEKQVIHSLPPQPGIFPTHPSQLLLPFTALQDKYFYFFFLPGSNFSIILHWFNRQ